MIIKDLELEAFEVLYGVSKGFFDNDNIITDIEISNNLAPDWDYKKAKPICVGFLLKNKITIFIAESDNDIEFNSSVKKFVSANSDNHWSFNKNFEQTIFNSVFNINYANIKEIKPFFAKFWTKDKFFKELIRENVIDKIEFQGDSEDKAKYTIAWDNYLETKDKEYLNKIAIYCMNNLFTESIIQKNLNFFKENYNINKKGWLVGYGKKKVIVEGIVNNIFNQNNNVVIQVEFSDKDENKRHLELRSYYKMIDGKPEFMDGSNWNKYKLFYNKEPEVGDIVKIEPDSKETSYHVLL